MNLFLDDIRNPPKGDWNVVRDYDEFIDFIIKNGLPDLISFDHDLADVHYNPNTHYDCAKWLIEYCLDNNKSFPKYLVHSMNPVGTENILSLLNNFNKSK